ncbi:MAG: amidohydrolase [Algoriphagus sp.]|nr:amidohydrolase [Algoriphagus sp.]
MPVDPLIQLRRALHQNPEIAGEETSTAKRILNFFDLLKPDQTIMNLGGHGLAFVFKGENPGIRTLYRCELDALPITELGEKEHLSLNPGKGHLCGHDGHMAILCGLGERLAEQRPENGEVVLLFQPAEETGQGAKAVLEDPRFGQIRPDQAFALHNLPGFPLHQVVLRSGPFAAGSTGMTISLSGKTSHAAHPEDGINPAQALAKLIQTLPALPDKLEGFSLVTIVHAELGSKAFGTSAGEGSLSATLRAFNQQELEQLVDLAKQAATDQAKEHGLKVEFSFEQSFAVSKNNPDLYKTAETVVNRLGLNSVLKPEPFRWSEDFGVFSQVCPAFLFGLGAGKNCPQLHEATYDFPDELIETGVKIFEGIVRSIHGEKVSV